jgi:hypothetical protein
MRLSGDQGNSTREAKWSRAIARTDAMKFASATAAARESKPQARRTAMAAAAAAPHAHSAAW